MEEIRVIGLGWGWMDCMGCPIGCLARPSTASAWTDPIRSCMPATNFIAKQQNASACKNSPQGQENPKSISPLILIIFIETVAASMESFLRSLVHLAVTDRTDNLQHMTVYSPQVCREAQPA